MEFVLFIVLFSVSLFFPHIARAAGPMPVVVINQIRGSESCCQPGTSALLDAIGNEKDFSQLPLGFAVRFDAFDQGQLVGSLKKLDPVQLGILLEITPKLASESGVNYKGKVDGSDWYHPRNAFLIGYSQDERKKLIDTAILAFKNTFNTTPNFSVAWMIDSFSLNYLRTQYGIKIHELTKEQFETDNYTLYGGIFDLPYFASDSHPLVPKTAQTGTLILRQTISDIDKNYGSFKAYFTSQPNDYLGSPQKLDLTYFKSLVTLMSQQDEKSRFALIGLENSQSLTSNIPEFISQLKYLKEKQVSDEIKFVSPTNYYESYAKSIEPGRFLKTADFPKNGVLWYFGEQYRIRLEAVNGQLKLTDLRIFWENLTDPYRDNPALVSRAYWVLPYVIDSSQEFTITAKNLEFEGQPVRSDPSVERFSLTLMQSLPTEVVSTDHTVEFKKDGNVVLTLHPESFECHCRDDELSFAKPIDLTFSQLFKQNSEQYVALDRHPRMYLKPTASDTSLQIGWEGTPGTPVILASFVKKNDIWTFIPKAFAPEVELAPLAPIFQPDKSLKKADLKNTIFYWNNTEAIAGRNPVRLYIDPRNDLNRPSRISRLTVSADTDTIKIKQPDAVETLMEPFFVDITSATPTIGNISINVDGDLQAGKTQVRFYRDCLKEFIYCTEHFDELKGYGKFLLSEQLKLHQKDIEKYSTKLKDLIVEKMKQLLPQITLPQVLKKN
jgi:hypothetical protein